MLMREQQQRLGASPRGESGETRWKPEGSPGDVWGRPGASEGQVRHKLGRARDRLGAG